MRLNPVSRRSIPMALAAVVVGALTVCFQARADEGSRSARWEKAIAAFEEKDKLKPVPKNAIVFVGSSSIRFWDVAKSFPGVAVVNRGFGGSELADSVYFAPRIVLPYEPRTVVLYAGDNDLAAGKTPDQVAADFRAFTRLILARLPKTRIVFICIKPSPSRWKLVEQRRQANALIAEHCKSDERLLYLDVATPMLDGDGQPRKELFRGDGLHLNAKGYELWATLVKPHLQ
jgi:lysophospholipase L1-like esterase